MQILLSEQKPLNTYSLWLPKITRWLEFPKFQSFSVFNLQTDRFQVVTGLKSKIKSVAQANCGLATSTCPTSLASSPVWITTDQRTKFCVFGVLTTENGCQALYLFLLLEKVKRFFGKKTMGNTKLAMTSDRIWPFRIAKSCNPKNLSRRSQRDFM